MVGFTASTRILALLTRIGIGAVVLLALGVATARAADWQTGAGITLSGYYSDNICLADDGGNGVRQPPLRRFTCGARAPGPASICRARWNTTAWRTVAWTVVARAEAGSATARRLFPAFAIGGIWNWSRTG